MNRPAGGRGRVSALVLLVATLGAAHAAVPSAPGLPAPRHALTVEPVAALVARLREAHAIERLRFAALALDELAQSYSEALADSHDDTRPAPDPHALERWRSAARESVRRAREQAGALALAADAQMFIDPGMVLRFIIDGRTIIVDDPDLGESTGLNTRVVRRYCAVAPCPGVFGPLDDAPSDSTRVWTSWSFGAREAAVLETSIGLDFRFADRERLAERKRGSVAFVEALARSAAELAWFRDRGIPVEWDVLHLAAGPDGAAVLVVNAAGDYLALTVRPPALPREPLARWYRATLAGRRFRWVFEGAERLFDRQGG